MLSGDSCDGDSCPNGDAPNEKDLSSSIKDISNKTGLTPQEVEKRIEKAKQSNLPKGTGIRNPDVNVDTNTGEIYPKAPGGGIGDSIGNIFD